jgi:glucose-1-phosphate adenylyltransferase
VQGRVERSVLGPGVVVAADAAVVGSVVFADAVVEAGARVERAVVDERCRISTGATVGGPVRDGDDEEDGVTVLGRDSAVGSGASLPAGTRLEPGSTAD